MPLKANGTKKEKLHVLIRLCLMFWASGDIKDIWPDEYDDFDPEFDPKIPVEEQDITHKVICYLWGLETEDEFDEWYKKYQPIIEGGASVLRIIPELEKQV